MKRSPASADGSPVCTGEHDVAEEAQPGDPGGRSNLQGRSPICFARLGIAVGMVVRQSKRSAIVAQDRIEHLAHGHERTIDGTLGNGSDLAKLIPPIADKYQDTFAACTT